jgi:hypothetical protein
MVGNLSIKSMQPVANATTPLTRRFGRRRFWRNLLGELFSLHEEAHGIPQMSLDDLDAVPPEVLAEMVPVWRQSDDWFPMADGIYRIDPETHAESPILVFTQEERQFAEHVGCGSSLAAIASQVSPADDDAFATIRALFINWSRQGWCHPAAPHLDHQP